MKTQILLFAAALIVFASCTAPKSYSDTAIGKKKVKYYNQVQNGVHPKKGPNF